jgi:repressor of nif and glnA expression
MILVIHDPIYVQDVVVAIAEPSAVAIVRAVVKSGYTVSNIDELVKMLDMDSVDGRTLIDPDTGAVIIRLKRLRKGDANDVSHLVHECVHAATMLFDRIGFPLKSKTDEPIAYYVAFLVRSILEKV